MDRSRFRLVLDHLSARTFWIPRQVLWAVGIVVAVVALVVLIRIGYALPGTGFGQTEVKKGVQPSKTLWDWMDLLIVPVVLAIGGYLFTRSESQATQAAAERQNRATQVAADRRAQDEALQAYLDQMSAMLLDKDRPLRQSKADADVRTLARARTLTVLPRLAGDGKGRVVQFLRESNLISRARAEQGEVAKVVDLSDANLTDANLFGLNLRGVALGGVHLERANLRNAYLPAADLGATPLSGADLTGASLVGASLINARLGSRPDLGLKPATLIAADLSGADLSGADLSGARLSGANLSGADLSGAVLPSATLWMADLSSANLTGAMIGWTEEPLDQAESLDGATMPDGTILKDDSHPNRPTFEEWRKSRG